MTKTEKKPATREKMVKVSTTKAKPKTKSTSDTKTKAPTKSKAPAKTKTVRKHPVKKVSPVEKKSFTSAELQEALTQHCGAETVAKLKELSGGEGPTARHLAHTISHCVYETLKTQQCEVYSPADRVTVKTRPMDLSVPRPTRRFSGKPAQPFGFISKLTRTFKRG